MPVIDAFVMINANLQLLMSREYPWSGYNLIVLFLPVEYHNLFKKPNHQFVFRWNVFSDI